METRPGISRVGDAGFVPHIEDPDTGRSRSRKYFVQVIADESEYLVNSEVLQGFNK